MEKKLTKADEEWQKQLTPEQYQVTRQKGTERAFTGKYFDHKGKGMYTCVCCGAPLFSSDHKFDSGTGWPSYFQPIDPKAVETETDRSYGMTRVEVTSAMVRALRRASRYVSSGNGPASPGR